MLQIHDQFCGLIINISSQQNMFLFSDTKDPGMNCHCYDFQSYRCILNLLCHQNFKSLTLLKFQALRAAFNLCRFVLKSHPSITQLFLAKFERKMIPDTQTHTHTNSNFISIDINMYLHQNYGYCIAIQLNLDLLNIDEMVVQILSVSFCHLTMTAF